MRSRLRTQRVRRLQAMRMCRLCQDTSDGQAADARSVNTDALAGWRAVSLLPIPLARMERVLSRQLQRQRQGGGAWIAGGDGTCRQLHRIRGQEDWRIARVSAARAPAPPPPSCGASGWTCATRMSRATRVRRRLLGGRGGKGGSVGSVGSSGDLQQRCASKLECGGGCGETKGGRQGRWQWGTAEKIGRNGSRGVWGAGVEMEGQESKTEVEEIKAQKGNCKSPLTRCNAVANKPGTAVTRPRPRAQMALAPPACDLCECASEYDGVLDTDPSLWPGDSGRFPLLV
ncbi:hypothetical protein B0H13DRAFT_38835 [Mycena leptocephala]|nr:hypothetical protein B0H13DRAFT_38835 [Mycena leptocephala]